MWPAKLRAARARYTARWRIPSGGVARSVATTLRRQGASRQGHP